MSKKQTLLQIIDLIEFRWSAFVIYSIASIFSVSLRLKGFRVNSTFIRDSIILGIGITTFTLILLLIGFRILDRYEKARTRSRYGVLLLLPAVGALRGCALYLSIDAYGYVNRISLLNSIISSMLYTSIYYGAASLFICLIVRKNRLFQSEFQQAAFLRLKRELESSSHIQSSGYEEAMFSISAAVTSKVPSSEPFDKDQVMRVAEEIKFQIQNVLRPLSHRLWIDSFGEIRIGSPLKIVRDAITELKISKIFIITYQFLIGIFGIGIAIGMISGISKSLIATISSLILFWIFENLWLKNRESSYLASSVLLLLIASVPVLASESLSALLNLPVDFLAGAIIAPALPAIIVVASVYGLMIRDKDFALSAARSIRQSEENDFGIDANSKESRELSQYLHNTLQSELLRISKQLEIANDAKKVQRHYAELNSALSRTREDIREFKSQGIERLFSVCKAWEGIARISLRSENLEGVERQKLSQIASFVEEIISNSIRYGEADEMSILLSGTAQDVKITVTHNGDLDGPDGKGLGSILIGSNSKATPRIHAGKTGVTLELTF